MQPKNKKRKPGRTKDMPIRTGPGAGASYVGTRTATAADADIVEAERQIERQRRMIAASRYLCEIREREAANYDPSWKSDRLRAQNALDAIQLEIAEEIVNGMQTNIDAAKRERGIA